MNEREVSEKLESYSQAIGGSSRRPTRHRSKRPWMVLVPIGAIAVCGFLLVSWPRYAAAATLRRFGDALTSAKSFEGNMYFLNEKGKWDHWLRTCHVPGRWRIERYVPANLQEQWIYKDDIAIAEFNSIQRAVIRPRDAEPNPFLSEGEPIDIIKSQLLMAKDDDSTLKIEDAADVDGNAVYKVSYKKPNRRVELIVSRKSDLPITADSWFDSPKQHAHWDYRFNVDFPKETFEVTKAYQVIDLRLTVPAFLASHSTPLASQSGWGVLDACLTDDGAIWIAARSNPGKTVETMPASFVGAKNVTYAAPVSFQTSIAKNDPICIYGYFPVDPTELSLKTCSMTLSHFTPGKPVPGHSDQVYASQVIPDGGILHIALRREHSILPKYFETLGLETWLRELAFYKSENRANALASKGRMAEAGKIYEQIASTSTSQFASYYTWREQAIRCYDAAHDKVDADRLRAELAAHR